MSRALMKYGWLAAALLGLAGARAQMAIGTWADCFDFTSITHVEVAGDLVYAAGRTGMFCYRTADRSATVMGKSGGLSDAGVGAMAYDPLTACLAVAYTNANIDLLCNGRVYNIPDIKRSTLPGDKSVYSIRFYNRHAYLATGFGVVVVDVARHEIKETWHLGADGGQIPVYDLAFTADTLYAATGEGLKAVALAERHPDVSSRWRTAECLPGLVFTRLAPSRGGLLAVAYGADPLQQSLLSLSPVGTDTLLTGDIRSLRSADTTFVVSTARGIWRFGAALTPLDSLTLLDGWADLAANDATASADGTLWVGHTWLGLVSIDAAGNRVVRPDGPEAGDNVFHLVAAGNRMLLCPGGHTTTYANSYIPPLLPVADALQWTTLRPASSLPSGSVDIVDACVNPADSTEICIALWGTGIASLKDGQLVAFYDETTTGGALHRYTVGSYSTLRTGALAFAPDGTLWALNSNSPAALVARRPDGSWRSYSTEALSPMLEADKLLLDSLTGYLWFAGRDNALYVHDGDHRLARINPNYGSKLQTQAVNCFAQDRTGNIWLGTNQGIKVIYETTRAFASGGTGETAPVACSNITISDRGIYEYLMAYENITAIAVDGANRKWVGTASGGLYLLSSDGLVQLRHFTASDSPLLSDKITTLALLPASGLLYIGTDRGLQVYRSDATAVAPGPDNPVYAFPNPVRPGYDGPVAIKGLPIDALVHITDAAGHTVCSTRALGGQAIWNLRTAEGDPVAAGVYYVFAATAEAAARAVTKILIIR